MRPKRLFGFAGAAILLLAGLAPCHADTLYVSNFGNNSIGAYDQTTGAFLGTRVIGGPEANGFNGVRLFGDGSFLVAGQLTNNLVHYSALGAVVGVFDPGNTAGLNSPQGVIFGPDGKVYVASAANDKILRYDAATGAFLDTFANLGANGHVGPIDLAFGPDGNLYVAAFDNGSIIKINGQTGAILEVKQGPPGIGFGSAVFGPDGRFYVAGLDLATFSGGVYRYDPVLDTLGLFIPPGAGGLQSPGGLAFGTGGNLLVADLIFDQNFNDIGSRILNYNGNTGAALGTLVAAGNGLNVPFFMTTTATSAVVPEPSSMVLLGIATAVIGLRNQHAKYRCSRRSCRDDGTRRLPRRQNRCATAPRPPVPR